MDGFGNHICYFQLKEEVFKKDALLVPPVKLVKLTKKSPVSLAITGLGVSQRGCEAHVNPCEAM